VDLADFCRLLQKKCAQEGVDGADLTVINQRCKNVISSIVGVPVHLGGMVLNCKHSGERVKDSEGLSIYFPTHGELTDYRALAIEGTGWIKVLTNYPEWVNEIPKLFTLVRGAGA
jgi:hypothetical protein